MNIRKGSVDLHGDQSTKSNGNKKLKRLNSKESADFDIDFLN